MSAVPHETDAVAEPAEPRPLLPMTDPRAVAIDALRTLPIGRRTPARVIDWLARHGIRVDFAPTPEKESAARAPIVECAQCGRYGEYIWRTKYAHVIHPPTVCALHPKPQTGQRHEH